MEFLNRPYVTYWIYKPRDVENLIKKHACELVSLSDFQPPSVINSICKIGRFNKLSIIFFFPNYLRAFPSI